MDEVMSPFTQGNYDGKVFSETKLHTCRIKFMTVIQFILKFKIFYNRDSNCIYM